MKNKKKIATRRKSSRKRSRYLFFIGGILILSSIFLFGNHGLIRFYQLQKQKQELIRRIAELKEEQTRLKEEINMLQNNYYYIEKIAREKYQMGKEGEKIYFMIPHGENFKK